MNTAHWHLMLNHFPMIGIIIGVLILVAGYLLKKNSIVKQVALGVFVFSALTAIPAYLTGEGAEEAVENVAGISESTIEEHEEMGKTFAILVGVLGVLALIALIAERKKSKASGILYTLVFILAVITSIYAKQLGTSGGDIRHTEIRSDSVIQPQDGTSDSQEEKNE